MACPAFKFLLQKGFDPRNKWTQKKIYIAEQKEEEQKKRTAEAVEEFKKSVDHREQERLIKAAGGDPHAIRDMERHPVNFMYVPPPGLERRGVRETERNGEDDEESAALKAKFEAIKKVKSDPGFSAFAKMTQLEKLAGKRKNAGATVDEQVERFPFLKNAPMEGAYVQNVKVTFKPVGIEVKNVRCLRCRAWGHQSGDRDCPLKDSNPLDAERIAREDPLYAMKHKVVDEANWLVLKDVSSGASSQFQLVSDGEDSEDNEPKSSDQGLTEAESEFIASLSVDEKRALLAEIRAAHSQGSGSAPEKKRSKRSSSVSSSSSSSSSDSDRKHRRKHKSHKRKKDHKKSHKRKHRKGEK